MTSAAMVLRREHGWIYKKWWDLPLLLLSAILVPLPFLAAWAAQRTGALSQQRAIDVINIAVATLIGGPHLFSTVTYTFLDPAFRRRHRLYLWSSLLLPAGVIYAGVYHYPALIQFFFTWASLHVLHQTIYLSDCYRRRMPGHEPAWSRVVDYGVILTALYPVGLYKIAQGNFRVGGVALRYPDFARPLHLPFLAGALFGAFLAAWLVKTVNEARAGRLSGPKTMLIGLTTLVSFLLPLGSNLDVLFQGYNSWHSFQYLFLLWFINRLRYQRGEIEGRFLRALVEGGGMGPYYLSFLGATGVIVLVTMAVRAATPLSADQSYFVVVLSTLLMHYYFDHFLFANPDLATRPV